MGEIGQSMVNEKLTRAGSIESLATLQSFPRPLSHQIAKAASSRGVASMAMITYPDNLLD